MPKKPIDEDRARRKALLEQKKAARRVAKEQMGQKPRAQHVAGDRSAMDDHGDDGRGGDSSSGDDTTGVRPCLLVQLPDDAVQAIFTSLSAADLGRVTMTCTHLNRLLPDARVAYLLSRLYRPYTPRRNMVGYTTLCNSEAEARGLLEQAYGGGDTGRIVPRGAFAKKGANDFIAYARFLQEAIDGYSTLAPGVRGKEPIHLPRFVQGRFASASPEHSLCRVGGDGEKCGAGGSGVASWGVGKRGQLGHGKRRDERSPRLLRGGLGFSVRIVQVSAGGGLVRIAHSLLLTSAGRVLSFGTGQYGALGHGYSAAKQLPDMLRPQYVEALANVTCVCVSAGELHSAVVTKDGDVYTWGDGFCGQLGHGDKRPQLSPKQVKMGGLDDECVASICCGSRHTLAVTEDGDAYSWGLGHFGVLGRSFTPFDYDADAAVVAFSIADPLAPAHAPDGAPPIERPQGNIQNGDRDLALMAHLDLISNLSLDDSSDQCIPKLVDALREVRVVGSSAGHRHSLFLDDTGGLYSCGSGTGGCLGHGDCVSQMYPIRVSTFDDSGTRIMQMSAGVDMSMAVSTAGNVYAWGKMDGGRIGLGTGRGQVTIPRLVPVVDPTGAKVNAIDVECGYVHSLIVGLNGTLFLCGGVGVEGEADGQTTLEGQHPDSKAGVPQQIDNLNIWHRIPEPKDELISERWKKYGRYEIKGRTKMMNEG